MSKFLKANLLAQFCLFILLAASFPAARAGAQNTTAAPDVLVLSNGDTLHGNLVKEVGGTVTFHSDALGDVNVPWEKIKELHAAGSYGVLAKGVKLHGRKNEGRSPDRDAGCGKPVGDGAYGQRRDAGADPGKRRGGHH